VNDFYNNSSNTLTYGELAKATDVEAKFNEVKAGFDKLPDEEELNRGTTNFCEDTGSADTYAVTMHQTPTAYVDGMSVVMRVANTNTGACTLNVNSLGAKNIKRQNGEAPEADDLEDGSIVELRYDEDNDYFVILSSSVAIVDEAQDWATKTGSAVSGTDYSSKEHAVGTSVPTGSAKQWAQGDMTGSDGGSAKDWAQTAEDSEVTTGSYSAYHWAQKAMKAELFSATSSTSIAIAGSGSKVFTLNETNRAFAVGSPVRISETADPTTNYMIGVVTSYSSNDLTVTVSSSGGSGTISAWTISLHIQGDADTVDGYHLDQDVTSGSSPTFNAENFTNMDRGLVLISAATASDDAAVDFSGIDSTYDEYQVHLQNVIPATDARNFQIALSDDSGSTWENAVYVKHGIDSTGESHVYSTSATPVVLTYNDPVGSDTNENGISGIIRLFDPSASSYTHASVDLCYTASNGDIYRLVGALRVEAASQTDMIRFTFASGNIESGKIKLYGVRKS